MGLDDHLHRRPAQPHRGNLARGRSFENDRGDGGWPAASALAVQFADTAAANNAYIQLRQGVGSCPTRAEGYHFDSDATTPWAEATVPDGQAEWSEFAYTGVDDVGTKDQIWESIGLIQIGDRVAITTYRLSAEKHEHALGGSAGAGEHEQLTLIEQTASRLVRTIEPAAQPNRSVSPENVLDVVNIPVLTEGETLYPEWVESDVKARSTEAISVCQQGTLAALGATSHSGRSFRIDNNADQDSAPEVAHTDEANVYATALQFPDAAAAKAAYTAYKGWVDSCGEHLKARDYTLEADDPPIWKPASTVVGTAEWTLVRYRAPGEQDGEPEFHETVGLVQVGDRLTVTVAWNFTITDPYDDTVGGTSQSPENPQYDLLADSAWKLLD